MAYLVIVINSPNDSIQTLNDQAQLPTKVSEDINSLVNVLAAIAGGNKPASVQVTTRDTDPAVTTHGTKSEQETYNHL